MFVVLLYLIVNMVQMCGSEVKIGDLLIYIVMSIVCTSLVVAGTLLSVLNMHDKTSILFMSGVICLIVAIAALLISWGICMCMRYKRRHPKYSVFV